MISVKPKAQNHHKIGTILKTTHSKFPLTLSKQIIPPESLNIQPTLKIMLTGYMRHLMNFKKQETSEY